VNFGPAARIANRLFGIPYTLVAHGIDIHAGLPQRTIESIRGAARLIAVSEWTRARVLGLGGTDSAKIDILPNTFDEIRFSPGKKSRALLERYSLRPDEKIILSVARLESRERYKGYDRIVEALPRIIAQFGEVRFLIVGSGEDRSRVEQLARDLGVSSAVVFAGFVDSSELADHYRLADVFAMPSTGEGFGIVFLEAVGSGVPVVAGNRDGSVDALDNGRLGMLVDPLDVNAIADAVSAALERRGDALWFNPQALHEAASARFGHRAFVQKLSEVMQSIPQRERA
jgi:glycosyltransferase involved in cell wall biosynthesis